MSKRKTASEPTKKAKRARVTVNDEEKEQCTSLETFRLPLYRADAFYMPQFCDAATAKRWHDELNEICPWYQPQLKVYGKPVTQSRHIAAYAKDEELAVKYSGTDVIMHHEYPPVLQEIQLLVEEVTGVTFNHVMLNRYEHGNIYIGSHRDNLENRVIASVSVGASRTFVLEYSPPKKAPPEDEQESKDKLKSKRFVLENGSLLVMQGTMQQYWKHSIPKEPKIKDSRISLTFRQLLF